MIAWLENDYGVSVRKDSEYYDDDDVPKLL